jgi:NADH oxidase (H2O2-forming)
MDTKAPGGVDPKEWSPRVVIVGGGVSGYAAARRLHRDLPRARIRLIDRNAWHHYSACGMTFALEGLYPLEGVLLHTPQDYEEMGIEVNEGVDVTSVDIDARTARLSAGGEARYDVLVLATGRRAFKPPVPGIDLPGVHTLSNYGDAELVMEAVKDAGSVVVVGGGAIGLETAMAFRARGLDVTVVEMLPHLLPQMLDADLAQVVRDYLEVKGARVMTGMGVSRVSAGDDGRADGIEVLGEHVPADLVVVSTGVRPEAGLAEASGIDVGKTGGFATDEHMRVLRDGEPVDRVYAVGDCAEVTHAVLGRKTLSPLASTAVYEARTISKHLVDPSYAHRPVVAPAVVVIGELHVGSVGLTEQGAEHSGIGSWGIGASGLDRSRYFPGTERFHIRLVGDGDGNLIGAQAVGMRDIKERINLMALVISEGIAPERLVEVERAFSPPVQLLVDPLMGLLEEFIDLAAALED